MTADEQLMWGSHLPALGACLAVTETLDVLEIGMGQFSTPFLHAYCVSAGRKLVSVEADTDWATKMFLEHDLHSYLVGPYDQALPPLASRQWGVVLIDNSPGGERRRKDFEMFFSRSQYVIVHDYHLDNEAEIGPLLDAATMEFHVCKRQQPPTLIVSKYVFVPKGVREL